MPPQDNLERAYRHAAFSSGQIEARKHPAHLKQTQFSFSESSKACPVKEKVY
jgi:hypothetical protein